MKIEITEDERDNLIRALMVASMDKENVLEIDWEIMDGFLRKIEL